MSEHCLLDKVLRPGELSVVFQPVFEVLHGGLRLFALECLARGPKGTNLEPAPILFEYVRRKRAEVPVDRACISAALEAAGALPVTTRIFLNVHASTLGHDPYFASFLSETARRCLINLSEITVEIVEHTPYWDRSCFQANLDCLRSVGVKIALDDFGLGQSNLRMILDCRPDYIKIDRYLIKGCHADPCRQLIIESISLLAWKLGATVIAEGIEDSADLEAVRNLGINTVQGYIFSPPISLLELLVSDFMLDLAL